MFELVYYLDDAMALAGPFRAWVGLGGLGGPVWAGLVHLHNCLMCTSFMTIL